MPGPITALPPAPSTSDPDNFDAVGDTFLAALPPMVEEINEVITGLNNLSTTTTSVSSVSIGTGTKNFVVEDEKSLFVGMSYRMAYNADNWMNGEIISYDSVTGALSLDVDVAEGSGTYAAWVGTLSFSGTVSTDQLSFTKSLNRLNRLINPSGAVYQRVQSVQTSDDNYLADGWYALHDLGTVTGAQLSNPEDGYPSGMRLTQTSTGAPGKRMGIAQIIEGKYCKDLRGKNGTLTSRIRCSVSQPIRYAILGWTGTEDAVTSDVVNDWSSSVYTAGNFFIGSNLSVLAFGSETPAANTWTTLAPLTAALGSSFNNIIVMIWTEGVITQNATLDFDYIQFEQGDEFTAFETREYDKELLSCYRYYYKVNGDVTLNHYGQGFNSSTTAAHIAVEFKVPMRIAPTALSVGTTAGNYQVVYLATQTNCSAVPTFLRATEKSALSVFTVASGLTAGQGCFGRALNTDGFMAWSADL